MQIDASDIINRLTQELALALQGKVIAEAQAASAEKELQEYKEANNGS